jgi:hypothetical protein
MVVDVLFGLIMQIVTMMQNNFVNKTLANISESHFGFNTVSNHSNLFTTLL